MAAARTNFFYFGLVAISNSYSSYSRNISCNSVNINDPVDQELETRKLR